MIITKEELGEKIREKINSSTEFKNISDYANKRGVDLANLSNFLKGKRTDSSILEKLEKDFCLNYEKVTMYEHKKYLIKGKDGYERNIFTTKSN